MARDLYEILGVDSSASDDDLKKAYRRLARQHHPDANPGDAESEANFKEIQQAYETLRDPERRRRYDMFGPESVGAGAQGFGAQSFGLNDLFDAFFGDEAFGGRARGPAGPVRGADAETAVELTLAEAVFGATKVVELRIPISCEACDGSGCSPGTHAARCTSCDGSGAVRQVRRSLLGQLVTAGPCPECGASGSVIPSPCEQCRGDGRVVGVRHLDVEIPAGIDDGQRLRLAGRGPAGPRGGPTGDLYVGIRVASHPDLERHGDELLRVLRVSVAQAALGSVVSIETLDGIEEVEILPGTQHGAIHRLRGLGAPSLRSGRRGDLVVKVEVEVPMRLTAEQAELLAQFAALRGEEITPPRDPGLLSRIRSAFQER